jgi:hypothetical protein
MATSPMKRVFSDSDDATERAHLELLRRASPGRRLGLALSVSATVLGLSRRGLARAEPGLSREPSLLSALGPVLDALETLGVRHYVGGSLASSAHGIPRASIDADILAELQAGDWPGSSRPSETSTTYPRNGCVTRWAVAPRST